MDCNNEKQKNVRKAKKRYMSSSQSGIRLLDSQKHFKGYNKYILYYITYAPKMNELKSILRYTLTQEFSI